MTTLDQVGSQNANVTETTTTVLPGGHWMKVVPKQKLTIGQYALMEVLGPRAINQSVWDFAISRVRRQSERDSSHQSVAGPADY